MGIQNLITDVPYIAKGNDYRFTYIPVDYTKEDVTILRKLAGEYMEYASLPRHQETIRNWERLNDLKPVRPMLWHNELPWHEMNVDNELTMLTSTPFARRIEEELRKKIYLWRHMRADMVLEPAFYAPLIFTNSGIGLSIEEKTAVTDDRNDVVGHEYIPVISTEEDLEKIKDPEITPDVKGTEETYQAYCEIFRKLMPVEKTGVTGFWFAPIDDVVMFMGTSELLENVYDDPDLVHASMKRICEAYMHALDQFEEKGLLASNNKCFRVGSGAYGYSAERKAEPMQGRQCNEIWGACASQFFTSFSPEMQDEFCLTYEKPWLERFAGSYYGCCERLDHKVEVVSKIRNLRKISCSPWSNPVHMAEMVGRKYVVSLKPSPAVFAYDVYDEELAEKSLREKLDALKDCNVEIIIKDVSTIRYDPQRLWHWVNMAHDMIQNL